MISSIIWLGLTIVIWLACVALAKRLPYLLIGNPLVLGIICICLLLHFWGEDAQTYLKAVYPLTFFVGLATVALAIPLWQQRVLICNNASAMFIATFIATLSGIGTAWLIGTTLGLSAAEFASIAPKMTTLAVALPLSTSTGGWESLTILGVMCNGVGGVLISEPVWRIFGKTLKSEDKAFALGTTSHAMGIARALSTAPYTVAFASCGMLLSALMTTALYAAFELWRALY
ncbi:LrgB family protein [Brucella pseudogrignonensis]|uniref:LrgB family protein n=1 Tax=Brucella pseudogrignonensis TaxID=419475 RepID=UPI001E52A724|nr:LrgB family protein [Brucella pseudogrignonensis]MCD4512058.1 LrgB family protein [Brucella pseudogrignonensis]